MNGRADVCADLNEVQRVADRALAALSRARKAQPVPMRPVRGLEQVTRVAAGSAATLFVACIGQMAG